MTGERELRPGSASGFGALTGTPGTGKSSVALELSGLLPAIEMGALWSILGGVRGARARAEIDLSALGRSMTRLGRPPTVTLVVGHLSHQLPIQDVLLLRCHPRELAKRLSRRGSGGPPRDLAENVVSEATDLILLEAVRLHRRIWEIDTSGRSPSSVAREVARILRHGARPRQGVVDWLADPDVTEHLLPRFR